MNQIHSIYKVPNTLIRVLLIFIGAILISLNINTFVHSAGLIPGGFTGFVLLILEIFKKYLNIQLPFSLFYWIINAVPAAISFKFIGKKFTIYSCLMIILSGLFIDIAPGFYVTDDVLLSSIFGGLINAAAVSCCLFANATSGGTDFIAIFVSERTGKNAWNFIFAGNCIILIISGILFGWTRALYSIIFQFSSTQALNYIYRKYSKTTLLIVTDFPMEIYKIINKLTNHDATILSAIGCYKQAERKILYAVVYEEEVTMIVKEIRKIDNAAFINILQSKNILGRFFRKPND